ncbi:MAG: YbaB/EbfC family nucleoid-associated protein [Mycobacteriales bacterium]
MSVTPEMVQGMRARLDQVMGEYDRIAGGLRDMRARMREISGTARSDDGGVTVTVGPRGTLTGLEITPRAYRKSSPSELAELILAVAAKAVADLNGQMEEVMRPFLPPGTSYADAAEGRVEVGLPGAQPLTEETLDEWLAGFNGFTRRQGGSEPDEEKCED